MEAITEKELEVAQILQMLPKLLPESDHRVRRIMSIRWGAKKKRRSADAQQSHNPLSSSSPQPNPPHHVLPSPPPPPPKASPPAAIPSINAQKAPVKVSIKMEATSAAATSSPASPLCFYPSGGEETDQRPSAAFSSPSTRLSKKVKVQNKEWIKEQNYTISRLYEINQNLQQEASDFRNRYEALSAENSRLKDLKSMRMEQRRMDQQKQQVLYRESSSIYPPPVDPAGPTTAHGQQRHVAYHSKLLMSPPFSIDQKPQPQMDHRSTTSDDHAQYQHHHVGVVSPQFWSLGGGGVTGIPDLNASVDDTGFGFMEPKQQSQSHPPAPPPPAHQHQQVMVVVERQRQRQRQQQRQFDAKKMATAEARKKRIEINRRKAAAGGGSAALVFDSASRVEMALER